MENAPDQQLNRMMNPVIRSHTLTARRILYTVHCPTCDAVVGRHVLDMNMLREEELQTGELSGDSKEKIIAHAANAATQDEEALCVHVLQMHMQGSSLS